MPSLQVRMGWGGRPEWMYYQLTALYSLAPYPDCCIALGLWIIRTEEPELAVFYGDEFEEIMAPMLRLVDSRTVGTQWQRRNPWTARHFPEVGIAMTGPMNPEWQASEVLSPSRIARRTRPSTSSSRRGAR